MSRPLFTADSSIHYLMKTKRKNRPPENLNEKFISSTECLSVCVGVCQGVNVPRYSRTFTRVLCQFCGKEGIKKKGNSRQGKSGNLISYWGQS